MPWIFYFLLLFSVEQALRAEVNSTNPEHISHGTAKFGEEQIENIHANGSVILDGTLVLKLLKVHGHLEAYEADIHNLKLYGEGHLKKTVVQVKARVNGDLKAEESHFKNGIAASAGHITLSNCTSGPIDFQQPDHVQGPQQITLINGTIVNSTIIFEHGKVEISMDSSSKVLGEIVGEYTLKKL